METSRRLGIGPSSPPGYLLGQVYLYDQKTTILNYYIQQCVFFNRAKGFRVDIGAPLLQDRRVFRIQFGQDLESY